MSFYRTIRPLWGPVRRDAELFGQQQRVRGESLLRAVVNVILGGAAILGLYLFPMYLLGHWHGYALICLGFAVAAIVGLKFTWYDNLPE